MLRSISLLVLFTLTLAGALPTAKKRKPVEGTFEAQLARDDGDLARQGTLTSNYFRRCQHPDHGNEFAARRCEGRLRRFRTHAEGRVQVVVGREVQLATYDFERQGFQAMIPGSVPDPAYKDRNNCPAAKHPVKCAERYEGLGSGTLTVGQPTTFVLDFDLGLEGARRTFFLRVHDEEVAERYRTTKSLAVQTVFRVGKPWHRWLDSCSTTLTTRQPSPACRGTRFEGLAAEVLAYRVVDVKTNDVLFSVPPSQDRQADLSRFLP